LSKPADDSADSYALAYDAARPALGDQEAVVSELRSRSGVLIASAAITTSFLGRPALEEPVLHLAAWIAIGCFAGLGASVLLILWPRRDWTFAVNARELIATYIEPPDGEPLALPLIHRDLALHMTDSTARNRDTLRRLFIAFRVGAVLLVLEVLAWIVSLIAQA
jgi:hypothetical protein